jgi:hypothetical protein
MTTDPIHQSPTDEELLTLLLELSSRYWQTTLTRMDYCAFARAALARWGNNPITTEQ